MTAHWLVLDGIFYQGDIWLDGGYVGDTEGYFFPHEFEVTEALSRRSEHLLGVEAACARNRPEGETEHHRRVPALGLR